MRSQRKECERQKTNLNLIGSKKDGTILGLVLAAESVGNWS
jgi:hypothetical protein